MSKYLISKKIDFVISAVGIGLIILGVLILVSNKPTKKTKYLYPTPFVTTDLSKYKIYEGTISPRIPYEGIQFLEVDPYNFTPIKSSLNRNDFHYEDYVMEGYTFSATKGDTFDFYAKEENPWDEPRSFIETELYGWGPTVIKMGTRISWGVPVNGRYFYVVKGFDVNRDVPGKSNPEGKYGNYTLSIIKKE